MGVANRSGPSPGASPLPCRPRGGLAFSYQGEAFGKRLQPLAASVGSDLMIDVDVTNGKAWTRLLCHARPALGVLDFVIHAIAFSDKNELTGRFINTTKGNFLNSLNISCFSFMMSTPGRTAD